MRAVYSLRTKLIAQFIIYMGLLLYAVRTLLEFKKLIIVLIDGSISNSNLRKGLHWSLNHSTDYLHLPGQILEKRDSAHMIFRTWGRIL